MRKVPVVDVIDVKQNIDSGRLQVKLTQFGDVLLEDIQTGEAVKIWTLPQPLRSEVRTYWRDMYYA